MCANRPLKQEDNQKAICTRTATDYWCHLPFIPLSHTPIHSSQPLFPPVCLSSPLCWQPWQFLRSGGCWWPLDPAVTQHTPPAPASSQCVRVCALVFAWASGRVYVRLFLRMSVKIVFFLCFFSLFFDCAAEGLAGWAAHLLSAANNPNVSVTAGKSLFKWGAWRAARLIWLWAVEAHKYILPLAL